jgi:hypothetical protein
MCVERNKENGGTIPVGIPHSIGRKFRIAMTNIRREAILFYKKYNTGRNGRRKLTAIFIGTQEPTFYGDVIRKEGRKFAAEFPQVIPLVERQVQSSACGLQ